MIKIGCIPDCFFHIYLLRGYCPPCLHISESRDEIYFQTDNCGSMHFEPLLSRRSSILQRLPPYELIWKDLLNLLHHSQHQHGLSVRYARVRRDRQIHLAVFLKPHDIEYYISCGHPASPTVLPHPLTGHLHLEDRMVVVQLYIVENMIRTVTVATQSASCFSG